MDGVDASARNVTYQHLQQTRQECLVQVVALQREFDRVLEASIDSNADDEHDPEGSTIAFERAQLDALLRHAASRLAEVETALDQLADGGYGRCAGCAAAIDVDRLLARPATPWCIDCARARAPRRR